jgi:hypothetical protein
VVRTRHVEQVGYPSTATEPQVDRQQATPAGASASTNASEAASSGRESASEGRADVAEPTQGSCVEASLNEEPEELGNLSKPFQPEHDDEVLPATPHTTERQIAPTSTLSSDIDGLRASQVRTPNSGCRHVNCVADASLREVSFTVRWLDGGQSNFLGYGLLCDQHYDALATCSVDRIRVGHSTMIRTISPAVVTEAA